MTLTKGQEGQIKRQLAAHRHDRYETDIELDTGEFLHNFIVYPYVLRPEMVAASQLAGWLYRHPDLYRGKVALDMGSGSGLQGIIMSRYGADWVVMSDIYPPAAANSKANVLKFDLQDRTNVLLGDLFEKIESEFDLIVFNHPIFSASPIAAEPASIAMLDSGNLLNRFFQQARKYLRPNGSMVMPYWHFAGPVNDPGKQASRFGLRVLKQDIFDIDTALHQGPMSVYQLAYES